jgi:hypothetical protein
MFAVFSSYRTGLDDEKVVERYGPRISGPFSKTCFFVSFLLSFSLAVEYFGTWLRFAFFRLARPFLVRVLDDVTPIGTETFPSRFVT